MKQRLLSLTTPIIDASPFLRRLVASRIARHYRAFGANETVVADALANAERVPIMETQRLMQWAASINHGAPMPRSVRPDVALQTSAAKAIALRSIEARLDRAPNIQLERQRLYLDDNVSMDDVCTFVRDTLTSRLEARTDGAYKQTLKVRHAFAVMSSLIDRLSEAGHRPFLVSGTLLGVVREGDLLEHDYDVDLGLLPGDGTVAEIAALAESVPGFVVLTEEHRVLARHSSGVGIDIFLHYERDGLLWHATDIHEWWNTSFELAEIAVRGRQFLIPDDSERYLTENYGAWGRSVAFYHMSFDTPNRRYRANKQAPLYLYSIFLTALENDDRFIAESAARELRDYFDIDVTPFLNSSALLERSS